ncbi:hypothetical protein F5I97DRAFT_1938799 [Phlebopus sp. FC_14]|nr:hypothetical protein F5I97DRAFT_1938799 [Phlebopus sp. FC_14]
MAQPKIEKLEPSLSFVDIPEPTAKEIAEAKKSLRDITRAMAWPVHRWPIDRHICEYNTRVHLPRTYLCQKGGEDVRVVRRGTDVNQFIHRHYLNLLEMHKGGEDWVNYVHADQVVSRRHEYLGPDPRVAGYFFDSEGEIHIKWWDAFLKDQWMDGDKWSLNVMKDATGKWVVRD